MGFKPNASHLPDEHPTARPQTTRENFILDTILISENIKIDTDQIVETEEISIDKIEVDLGMNKIIGEEISEAT